MTLSFKKFIEEKDPRLKRAGVAGFNKAKRSATIFLLFLNS